MPKPSSMLIITTNADFSARLFFQGQAAGLIRAQAIDYNATPDELRRILRGDFKFLYLRDPFNDVKASVTTIKNITQKILSRFKDAYKVDGISSYDDLLFEDKWRQYQLFSRFMPKTELLDSLDGVDFTKQLIKKRISCRSRDIIFDKESFPKTAKPDDYIVQDKINIEQEYRVYMVGDKIVEPIAIKSHKTPNQTVKIIGLESSIKPGIGWICRYVYQKTKFGFVGLDIAKTQNGHFLLEANRSCQFKSYFRISSINLAQTVNTHLLNH